MKNSKLLITPTIETIKNYSYNLAKNVNNLVVEHPEYGKIVFNEGIDVTNINFDEDLLFKREGINISK